MKRAIAIILAISLALGLNTASAAITAPAAGDAKPTSSNWLAFIYADERVTTADFNSAAALTIGYGACNLHYVSTVGSSNKLTVTLEGSNNGKNWVAFAPLVITAATTSQNDMYAFNNPTVQYLRVSSVVSNSNPITISYFMACR